MQLMHLHQEGQNKASSCALDMAGEKHTLKVSNNQRYQFAQFVLRNLTKVLHQWMKRSTKSPSRDCQEIFIFQKSRQMSSREYVVKIPFYRKGLWGGDWYRRRRGEYEGHWGLEVPEVQKTLKWGRETYIRWRIPALEGADDLLKKKRLIEILEWWDPRVPLNRIVYCSPWITWSELDNYLLERRLWRLCSQWWRLPRCSRCGRRWRSRRSCPPPTRSSRASAFSSSAKLGQESSLSPITASMSPVLTLGNFISTRSALLSLLLLDASIYCPFNFLLFDLLSFTFCWLRQELFTQSCAIEIHTQQYTQPAIQ